MVTQINLYYYLYIAISATVLAIFIGISLYSKTTATIVRKIIHFSIKPLLILLLFAVIFSLFFFYGRNLIDYFSFLKIEYIHLTIVAIVWVYLFRIIKQKGWYDILNIFGAVLFIIWLGIYTTIISFHIVQHFNLVDKSMNLFNYLVAELPGNFKILPYFIVFSLVIIIILLIYINVSRITKIIITYIEDRIRTRYQDKIIELIYEDTSKPLTAEDKNYFKNVKQYRFTRTIFTDELLRMHEILFGNINERINEILMSIGVLKDAFFYLHHNKWHFKIKGLRDFAQLNNKSELFYINKLVDSKNHVLRIEAQLALARLTENDNPVDYLKNLKHKLTLWEQINLIHYFTNFKKPIGNISNLLTSKNATVNHFGLRCAGIYNLYEHYDLIINLTKHEDKIIQEEAYESLALYQVPESADYIISKYHSKLPITTQIAMIKALGHIGNKNAIPFLKDLLLFEVEYQTSIELFKAILQIDPKEAEACATIGDMELLKIFNHVNDSRIL